MFETRGNRERTTFSARQTDGTDGSRKNEISRTRFRSSVKSADVICKAAKIIVSCYAYELVDAISAAVFLD